MSDCNWTVYKILKNKSKLTLSYMMNKIPTVQYIVLLKWQLTDLLYREKQNRVK